MKNNETIHDRISQLVNEFGKGKNTVFASIIGSNEANVRGYKTSVMPKFDFLEKIARNIEVDLKWLLTGEGSMLHSDQAQSVIQQDSSGETAAYYKMYKEKDAEASSLKEEIGALKLKISQLEAGNIGGKRNVKNVFTEKHSSLSTDDAGSAHAHSK